MTAREIAFRVLRRVEEGGAFASRALDAELAAAGFTRCRADPLTYGIAVLYSAVRGRGR